VSPAEAAALLTVAAAFDNRKPDEDAARAWSMALDGLRFHDCRDAIVAHYRTSSEWLMPQKIRAEVKRIRDKRIADYGPIPIPHGFDPDDTGAYERHLREMRQRIGDGEDVPQPTLPAPSKPPAEIAQQMRQIGRVTTTHPELRPNTEEI